MKLPRAKSAYMRIVHPEEAARLLAALPEQDRPLWATAIYGGLRRGELRALRWGDVDLAKNVIHVQRGWDDEDGEQGTKSDKAPEDAHRPRPSGYLVEQRIRAEDPDGLVFGRGSRPFSLNSVRHRARRAWEGAKLEPLTMHECRHRYASTLIAVGATAKAISIALGHSNIQTTFDKYGKLMPGNEAELAGLLDA